MAKNNKRKFIRYFLLIFWGSIFSWQFYQMNATGFDESIILLSSDNVEFKDQDNYLSFYPKKSQGPLSILFFPGALVQPKSYAPLAHNLAYQGYSVHIQKIPLRIAITDKMEERALINAHEFIQNSKSGKWIIAGHSRGGRMAANFTFQYPESIDGMILLGTSHPKEKDLSTLNLPVLKISGSEDGLATLYEVRNFAKNLPSTTNFVTIDGGNHSQFGFYGFQFGSGKATITRNLQQELTQNEILKFLDTY